MRHLGALLATGFLLAACGDQRATGTSAEHAYDGSLAVSETDAVHPRAGAAGNVVDCAT
jgi:hypothetical protein